MSYGIYIGRDHTADGHAWLAGYGDEPSSHWLELIPRQAHPPGSTVEVGVSPNPTCPACARRSRRSPRPSGTCA